MKGCQMPPMWGLIFRLFHIKERRPGLELRSHRLASPIASLVSVSYTSFTRLRELNAWHVIRT